MLLHVAPLAIVYIVTQLESRVGDAGGEDVVEEPAVLIAYGGGIVTAYPVFVQDAVIEANCTAN